jgi:hypothetical protein
MRRWSDLTPDTVAPEPVLEVPVAPDHPAPRVLTRRTALKGRRRQRVPRRGSGSRAAQARPPNQDPR